MRREAREELMATNVHWIGDGSPSAPARLYSGRNSWRMRGIAARRETQRAATPRERMAMLCGALTLRAHRQTLPSGGAR